MRATVLDSRTTIEIAFGSVQTANRFDRGLMRLGDPRTFRFKRVFFCGGEASVPPLRVSVEAEIQPRRATLGMRFYNITEWFSDTP
jgi:hypothetical protein